MRLGPIPVVGEYRGVPLHNMQSAERIAAVKADIDQVLSLSGIADLFAFAQDVSRAPEARLTAGALITARWQLCAEERRARPTGVSLDDVAAIVGGLDCEYWRDPWHYCCLLDSRPPGAPGPAPRDEPLD